MSELENHIKSYFQVDEQFITTLAALFHEETIDKNDFHTRTGASNSRLSFLKSGFLRVYRQEDEKEVTQWICSPGEFATDLSTIMFDQPARWNIQAMTDCECYSLSHENYRKIGDQIPNWATLEKRFIGKCFITLEDRVFSFLSMNADERYQYFYMHRKDLFLNAPQHYVASMLGMTPETFSRIRKKLTS